jgi:hypothetical protein
VKGWRVPTATTQFSAVRPVASHHVSVGHETASNCATVENVAADAHVNPSSVVTAIAETVSPPAPSIMPTATQSNAVGQAIDL